MKALGSVLVFLVVGVSPSSAVQPPEPGRRFDHLAVADSSAFIETVGTPAGPQWEPFRAAYGKEWSVYVDRRSGAPLLVEGKGIPWPVAKDATVASLAASLKPFIASHRSLLLADEAELVLDPSASGALLDDVWQIVFARVVAGVPVEGERYVFTIGHGNLISFGAPRWSRIDAGAVPRITAAEAREKLETHLHLTAADTVTVARGPELVFIPLRAAGTPAGRFTGTPGTGYASALVWRIALRVEGEEGTWLARVDAQTGAIRSLYDDDKHVRVKGGVFPLTNDAICPSGCEQPNYPMPFADITVAGVTQTASAMGLYNCAPTSVARTTLNGPYIKITDTCGAISQALSCAADLNLGTSTGTDCTVPSGASAGDTHASRTAFHHLNRIAEHGRSWLPSVPWLTQQFTTQVNLPNGCVGGWVDGGMILGRSGGGCFNAGENAGVMYHEWGHGLDENDGGGWDNPTEGYADVTALMRTHLSCIGRGFVPSNCTNSGDTCLNCTGAREDDWDQTLSHTPATPAGFATTFCSDQGADGGPCGKEQHCEGIVAGQAIWDLAVRDLPAMGLDPASAWALMDRLWYQSRLGSGGNAYNCALPDSDSCLATSWFAKIRAVDDDDGNLANGTPHAAAIFAAFNRHGLACGLVSDPSNQNTSSCAAIGVPTLTAASGSTSATAQLTWTTVPAATGYRILRNDLGCQAALTRLTTSTANSLIDANLANGIPMYYSVQAMAGNEACDGGISNCQQVTPQPLAGAISLDSGVYGCSASTITVSVTDGNGAATLSAAVKSTTETTAQTITLTKIFAGSTIYRGTILTTSSPPAADGLLSVANGDRITATYVDANDGGGGLNVPRVATATASCAATTARPVPDGSFGAAMKGSRANPGGTTINLTWDVATCTSSDFHVLYGDLSNVGVLAVTGASCDLGTSGAASWTGVPAGSLWFTLVGDDDGTTEGSWGRDGTHAERWGATVSGQCGLTVKNNTGTCP